MALTVIVRSGEPGSSPGVVFEAPRVVVGRGEASDVRLPDASVSHRHASFRQRGREWIVLDEGSTNGTFIGPVRLPPQAPRVLRTGDLVRVGRIWLEVRIEAAMPTENAQLATCEIALGLVAGALAASGEPAAARLRVAAGPDQGRELELAQLDRAYVVGRSADADLPLTDPDASRRQIEVSRRGPRLWVRELGSKNGSRLGQRLLAAGDEAPWPRGDTLAFGATELVHEDPVAAALDELERAADERMREDEVVETPEAQPEATAAPSPPPPIPEAAPASPAGAPAAERAAPRRPASAASRRKGWSKADTIVAVLAIAVLAASLLGLYWLLAST
ncbi:MAG: FHA domain-containing protein [Polyangiaceae bacterium]|nr:FHA domain-containing protein [Polyangiaceae bacterium]